VTTGFVLSVAAALVLGGYVVAVKQYFSHYPPTLFVGLTYGAGILWYLPVVALTVPSDRLLPAIGPTGVAVIVGTAGCTVLALLSFYHALAIGDVSYVAPISKIIPVFVLPLEVAVLGQRLSALQVLGVCVATVAVYVANYQQGSLLAPLSRVLHSRAALLALGSAAAFGVVDVGKRISMQELAVPPAVFVMVMLVLIPGLLSPALVRQRQAVDWWGDRTRIVGFGLVLVVGQHLVAVAFQSLPASIVSPIVNTQAIVAVVLGSLLLGESQVKTRLAAACLAIAGVALISV